MTERIVIPILAACAFCVPGILAQDAGPVIQALAPYGASAMLIGFFVWNGAKREESMTLRIRQLEDRQADEMQKLAQLAIAALTRSAASMERTNDCLDEMKDVIKGCPNRGQD